MNYSTGAGSKQDADEIKLNSVMPEDSLNEIEDKETFTYAAEKTKVLCYENAMLEHANV